MTLICCIDENFDQSMQAGIKCLKIHSSLKNTLAIGYDPIN